MDKFVFLRIFVLVSTTIFSFAKPNRSQFNVLDYGALPGTTEDSSQAFLRAWNDFCNTTTEDPVLTVPPGKTFLLNPVVFNGPCKPKHLTLRILGVIAAPSSPKTWSRFDPGRWLTFRGVTGLSIAGCGGFDGRGEGWWDQSCRDHQGLKLIHTYIEPQALSFQLCNNITLSNVHFINSPQVHVLIYGSSGIDIDSILIDSPGNSPNTDGIHIQAAQNISITNSIIGSGDDCVSIGDYTSNIRISDVECGPGHGISIGSLGKDGNVVQVENIHVTNVSFTNTTNGARIKTWQAGRGYVRDISYKNCKFDSVNYPIIIDQNYCLKGDACKEMKTGVHISNVTFDNFSGTSTTDVAISLNCSWAVGCTGIILQSIKLTSAMTGKRVTSSCTNAHGNAIGMVEPPSCLS
ncbi:polygalacturonase [Tripterygium wilfordii]|uniref:Polygalacturonase n=1 Tax=Tripterygium wilfordii TaxID=458696 RepID=A0A7J7D6P5_TRIWF|nr:polygalacturonase [Tripterygium wilfordii]